MRQQNYKNKRKPQLISNIILIFFGILFLMPFFWAFATSLRLPKDSFDLPPSFFPTEWMWGNYSHIFKSFDFLQFFWNSTKITFLIVIIGTLFTTMASFAIAKLNFKGKNFIFLFIIAGLLIPFQSYAIAPALCRGGRQPLPGHSQAVL